MLGCGFGGLFGGREMDKTVLQINRRTTGFACRLKRGPLIFTQYFIYQHAIQMPCVIVLVKPKANSIVKLCRLS